MSLAFAYLFARRSSRSSRHGERNRVVPLMESSHLAGKRGKVGAGRRREERFHKSSDTRGCAGTNNVPTVFVIASMLDESTR
jgi:hypothetical protein